MTPLLRSKRWLLSLSGLALAVPLLAAGCAGNGVAMVATATLAPIVSLTPRATATLEPSPTELPSATYTPSLSPTPAPPTLTPSPTNTPQVLGSVYSADDVNMREGPGVQFPSISALRPGTGFIVVATDQAGGWFNVRLEDGDEGWISATLVRLEPTETPLPSSTPTPDETLLALGGPLPTSILGGQPVTPTPPAVLTTPDPAASATTGVQLPNLAAINQTATALVNAAGPIATARPVGGPTGGPVVSGTGTAAAPIGNASVGTGVEVFAYCDDPGMGVARAPTDLVTGSTVEIVWAWYASTRELLAENIAAANYTVRLNGQPVENIVRAQPRQQGSDWWQYFYARTQPLNSGQHQITYQVTWDAEIFDGYSHYGPGTGIPSQSGTCTFTVR